MSNSIAGQLLFVLVSERQLAKKGPPMMRVEGTATTEKGMPLLLQFERLAAEKDTVRVGLYGWGPHHGLSVVYFRGEGGTISRDLRPVGPDDATPQTVRSMETVLAYLRKENVRKLLAPLYSGEPVSDGPVDLGEPTPGEA